MFRPNSTKTSIFEVQLEGVPVVIKICPNPSFNSTALQELGYLDNLNYYYGISKFNNSVFGWAGHTENGSIISTVEDVYHRVALYPTAEDLLEA